MSKMLSILLKVSIGLFALAVIIVVLVLLYRICKIFCIKRLEYKRYFSKEGAFEGEEIFLIEELTNHSFLPMFEINVESHVTSMIRLSGCASADDINQHFISSFYVKPFTKIKRKHKAVCVKRGYYKLETAQVTFADMDLYIDSNAELFVYPKEISPENMQEMNMIIRQGTVSKLPLLEDVFEYSGIRQYMSGDTISMINHKASAKMGKLMVNSHDFMMGRKIKIYNNFQPPFDRHMEIEAFKTIMETAMSYISYITCECAMKGYVFSYGANCKTVDDRNFIATQEATGVAAYMNLLREMAMTRIISNFSFVSLMDRDITQNINSTEVYVLTSYMDESIEARIECLEKMGNSVEIIYLTEAVTGEEQV